MRDEIGERSSVTVGDLTLQLSNRRFPSVFRSAIKGSGEFLKKERENEVPKFGAESLRNSDGELLLYIGVQSEESHSIFYFIFYGEEKNGRVRNIFLKYSVYLYFLSFILF